MSAIVLHQDGLRHLLRDPMGPTGMYIDKKAREVDFRAHLNVSGAGSPQVRSTDLHNSIRYGGLEQDTNGLVAYIVADAEHGNFPYPLALELGVGGDGAFPAPARQPNQRYRYPFLRPALEATFPEAVGTA